MSNDNELGTGVKVAKATKGAKAKGASKAKPAKAAKAKTARAAATPRVASDATFKVLAKEPPFRDGTKAAKAWAVLVKSKTIGDFNAKRAAGDLIDSGFVGYCTRNEFIRIA
jgi:hypothetical protein